MRALILATDVFTLGGIARYTSTMASAMGKLLGPENVDVLCFFNWGDTGARPTQFNVLSAVSGRQRAGVVSRVRFLLQAAAAGARGYDLVVANHVALAPVAAMMKLTFGKPYWVACHSVEVWWGMSRARQFALRRADLVLPVSAFTAEVVQKKFGIPSSRIRVLYNAVPDEFATHLSAQPILRAAPDFPDASPVLLSVCALVPGNEFKGVDTVIESLPALLKSFPSLLYIVVGEGELRPPLEALAERRSVARAVRFVGAVSDAELAALYRRCDVFVLPSRGQQQQDSAGGEGFGRVYVEAALAGKPVVGSRTGGAAEAVVAGQTGYLVNPDSSAELAQALRTLLGDPELAARMGSAGRAWAAKHFSEKALCEALEPMLMPYRSQRRPLAAPAEVGEAHP